MSAQVVDSAAESLMQSAASLYRSMKRADTYDRAGLHGEKVMSVAVDLSAAFGILQDSVEAFDDALVELHRENDRA